MSPGLRWSGIVVGLLAINMLAVGVLIVASGDPSPRLVPDAYRRAIEFDRTLAARAASAALGWRAEVDLGAIDGARDRVVVVLTDGTGAAVVGAQVEVAVRHASRARGATVVLAELAPGRYRAEVEAQGRGLHVIDVAARRGADHFAVARTVTLTDGEPAP